MNESSLLAQELDIADVMGISRYGRTRTNIKMGSEEISTACVFGCGAKDAFKVYPDMNYIPGVGCLGYYLCMDSAHGGRAGCGERGNVIDFIQKRDHLDDDFDSACEVLGINSERVRMYRKDQKIRQLMNENSNLSLEEACSQAYANTHDIILYREKETLPAPVRRSHFHSNERLAKTEKWQTNAYALARIANATLTQRDSYENVREYLVGRGLVPDVIKLNGYGIYDQYKVVNSTLWGYRLTNNEKQNYMVIPRGVVIPWRDSDHQVRCIRVRRLPWDTSEEAQKYYGVDKKGEIGRYKALRGVDTDQFYNAHNIKPGCKVALFEGEFTSAIAQYSCRSTDIVCVATGSTGWGFNEANLRLLASCERVLICFDKDLNDAGNKASKRWTDALENAKRWVPLWGDANDMSIDGVDVCEWLSVGFEDDKSTREQLLTLFPDLSPEAQDSFFALSKEEQFTFLAEAREDVLSEVTA